METETGLILMLHLDFNDLTPEAMAIIEAVAYLGEGNGRAIEKIHEAGVINCGEDCYHEYLLEALGIFEGAKGGK